MLVGGVFSLSRMRLRVRFAFAISSFSVMLYSVTDGHLMMIWRDWASPWARTSACWAGVPILSASA